MKIKKHTYSPNFPEFNFLNILENYIIWWFSETRRNFFHNHFESPHTQHVLYQRTKKSLDPGDIPVIQGSTFPCSVCGGGRRNHTEPQKQSKSRVENTTMPCSCRCSGSIGGFWESLWSLAVLYVGGDDFSLKP